MDGTETLEYLEKQRMTQLGGIILRLVKLLIFFFVILVLVGSGVIVFVGLVGKSG